jgi:L-alanine-DL-glutamate epimerase-like enolase superfamily enzyme
VGVSVELTKARKLALALKQAGFLAQKWYPPCSVGHGPQGRETNTELVRTLRETVGDGIELMFDAHQGWTREYAVEMARRMRPFRPRWLEEPVMADDIEGYRAVRDAAGFPIAGSEAHSNRWQALAMLKAGVVDVYQPDEGGTGGITEIMRIARLASDYGKQMVVHCGYLPTMHIVAALPRELCPYYEYLVNWNEYGQWFYKNKCAPESGRMPLPPGPGLGLELDESRIETREELSFS